MKMKIINVQSMPSYKGRVYQDKNAISKEIAKCPFSTREHLKEHIEVLSETLKTKTPNDARFDLTFEEAEEQKSVYDPTYYYGIIKLSNSKGKSLVNKFALGHLGGSAKDAVSVTPKSETIWERGFKDITQKVLEGELNENDISVLENSSIFKALDSETQELARYSFNKLGSSEKIVADKIRIAVAIAKAVNGCPDEVIETVIKNINTLTQRLEKETPDDKMFYIDVIGQGRSAGTSDLSITAGIYIPNKVDPFKGTKLTGKKHSINRFIATKYKPADKRPYCATNSEQIYEEIFKPITDKMLEIASK